MQTVEGLTGLTVDHYAEIGMAGVEQIVDAVGGVNLCHDADVNDADSGMVWTTPAATTWTARRRSRSPACARPTPPGDVGRAERQRQLIGAVMAKVKPSQLVLPPGSAGRADRRGHGTR